MQLRWRVMKMHRIESFDRAAGWLYEGMAKAYANGATRLAIAADNPMFVVFTRMRQRFRAPIAPTPSLSASARKNRRFRHQLEYRFLIRTRNGQKLMFPDSRRGTLRPCMADAMLLLPALMWTIRSVHGRAQCNIAHRTRFLWQQAYSAAF